MTRRNAGSWLLPVTLVFVALSLATYFVHYLIFRDARSIFFYLIMDVGFLFLNVLVVIVFIERVLARREKRAMLEKLNMVIGAFFSEVGLELLRRFSACAAHAEDLRALCGIRPTWRHADFAKAEAAAAAFPYEMTISPTMLRELRAFLGKERDFMVRLLENPSLLEHDRFTDLLWAVFHFAEELAFREGNLEDLPPTDLVHLEGDAQRAYSRITVEWLIYAEHLKENYPFLFSLAARINPFGEHPSATVSQ
ncbi:MAG TPA: hypothetical protein VHP61_06730 [Acidobacteriota bacterium]|nr:hypothetical protein [Acidobacteriota bacterium]